MKKVSDEKQLIEKYGSGRELDEYTKYVCKGLGLAEDKLISKYIKRGKILDIGCGAGREAIALAKKRFEVVGIDIVPAMVLRAKENAKIYGVGENTKFEIYDARNLDFSDGSYDAAIMLGNMIEHTRGRKNRVKLLKEAKRVLKPKGILILSTHTRAWKPRFILYWTIASGLRAAKRELTGNYQGMEFGDRFTRRVSRARSRGKVFIHIYTYDEALEDIAGAGLELIEAKCAYEIEKGTENAKRRKRARQVLFVTRKI